MDMGKIVEYDAPYLLLVNDVSDLQITRNGLFAEMVRHTGKDNSEYIFRIAKEAF